MISVKYYFVHLAKMWTDTEMNNPGIILGIIPTSCPERCTCMQVND